MLRFFTEFIESVFPFNGETKKDIKDAIRQFDSQGKQPQLLSSPSWSAPDLWSSFKISPNRF
jgi:hypothetical protein